MHAVTDALYKEDNLKDKLGQTWAVVKVGGINGKLYRPSITQHV